MVKRIASIRVIGSCLLAACGALCQSEKLSRNSLQRNGSTSEVQHQEMGWWKSLPDAPSAQAPTQAEQFHAFVYRASSPVTFGVTVVNAGSMRRTALGRVTLGSQLSLTALPLVVPRQKKSKAFFGKYLYPSMLKTGLRYHPSTSDSFMGRATYAASRIFITRDDSGKGRLNTSYLLGVLTSVAVDTAYRPYWARSPSVTFRNFGSTIANDAEINLLHEFGPGIRKLVKAHAPKFVSTIEERVTRNQTPRDAVSTRQD